MTMPKVKKETPVTSYALDRDGTLNLVTVNRARLTKPSVC